MKRRYTLAIVFCFIIVFSDMMAYADDSYNMNKDGYSTSYTYGYDYWGDVQESPDAYRVMIQLDSVNLQLTDKGLSNPQSLFVRGNDLYIVDTGNNRIIKVTLENGKFIKTGIIDQVIGSENSTFISPYDVFVDKDNNLYIADYGNRRVVMIDENQNFIKEFVKPDDVSFQLTDGKEKEFLPRKVVADVSGRIYVIAEQVNEGFVKFESDTTFVGYIGANKVTVDMAEYIRKRWFMSEEQRAVSENFVPTEYENIFIDEDGFLYATTTTFSEYDLKSDAAKPIRRLNGIGDDILVKNDHYPPIGDLYWLEGDSSYYGPSKLTDVTVLENDIYVVLDKIRGRLFGYDDQGVMLWAFGTRGNTMGTFDTPVSVESMGRYLFALDSKTKSITVFEPTEYGNLIYDAINEYQHGEYKESEEKWREVLKFNANYPLAFRGIGRSSLQEDKYETAMSYFKKAHDGENYGRALKLYRKVWVEKNVWWIVLIIAVLLIVPVVTSRVRRMKWEVIEHERNKANGK